MEPLAEALTGPVAVAAALLVAAGAPKAVAPADTSRALARMGLPSAPSLVRLGGCVEVALGVWALTAGGAAAQSLVALSYGAFAAVVALALRRGDPLSSCGCLGRPDTPPTPAHLALVGVLAVATALAGASGGAPALGAVLADSPGGGLPLLLACAVAASLAWLVLAVLPVLSAPPPTVRTLPLVDARKEAPVTEPPSAAATTATRAAGAVR